jgi:type VI secretion system protein ImpA
MRDDVLSLSLDITSLLAPITDAYPAGESLRYSRIYDQIQEARRQDDASLPQGVWQTKLKKADWESVQEICLDALTTHSKDLQLAVWLLEAWLHLEGFAGVTKGLHLLIGLCERFWDELHPAIEGDDLEGRMAPLIWMNEKLSLQLKQIPLTQPQSGDVLAYHWAAWERACHLEHVAQRLTTGRHTEEEDDRKITSARVRESAALSPTAFYVALAHQVHGAIGATTNLSHLLDAKTSAKSPSLAQFQETLMAIHRLIADFMRDRGGDIHTVAFDSPASATAPIARHEALGVNSGVGGGPIRSRAEAYQRLSEAADYLIRTEPHSPTPYLIKRAVSWGGMTLTELLQEIVRDDRDLMEIYTLLGVIKGREEE